MPKFFIPPPLESVAIAPWMKDTSENILFSTHLPPSFFKTIVERVATPEEASVIVLPNNFTTPDEYSRSYIATWADVSERLHIPLFLFSCGDYTDGLLFDPRALVFKLSLYKSSASPRDISMPTMIDDIGQGGITLRLKADRPTVSFCGKADFSSSRERLGSWVRRIRFEFASLLNPAQRAHVRGIFWRIRILRVCKNSSLVKTLFIVRKTFSGAARTIEVPPEQARKEFVESIEKSDFVLAPKGDGNYSNRFLEALAMGRIPVFIDTDMVLPLEDLIPYEKISVRIPMHRVSQTPQIINEWYAALSGEEWAKRQQLAREVFETYLRQDAFFRHYFKEYV
jgi:hypothetical protein